jgi:hypothetical protein
VIRREHTTGFWKGGRDRARQIGPDNVTKLDQRLRNVRCQGSEICEVALSRERLFEGSSEERLDRRCSHRENNDFFIVVLQLDDVCQVEALTGFELCLVWSLVPGWSAPHCVGEVDVYIILELEILDVCFLEEAPRFSDPRRSFLVLIVPGSLPNNEQTPRVANV